MTFIALDFNAGFARAELSACFAAMPTEALASVAQALASGLDSADSKRDEYWTNRVARFWHDYWPKNLAIATERMGSEIAEICVASGGCFPQALAILRGWIVRSSDCSGLLRTISKNGFGGRFPETTLDFLNLAIADDAWCHKDVVALLDEILVADPSLGRDGRLTRLRDAHDR